MRRLFPLFSGGLVGAAVVLTRLAVSIDPGVPSAASPVVIERTRIATVLVQITATPTMVPTIAPTQDIVFIPPSPSPTPTPIWSHDDVKGRPVVK